MDFDGAIDLTPEALQHNAERLLMQSALGAPSFAADAEAALAAGASHADRDQLELGLATAARFSEACAAARAQSIADARQQLRNAERTFASAMQDAAADPIAFFNPHAKTIAVRASRTIDDNADGAVTAIYGGDAAVAQIFESVRPSVQDAVLRPVRDDVAAAIDAFCRSIGEATGASDVVAALTSSAAADVARCLPDASADAIHVTVVRQRAAAAAAWLERRLTAAAARLSNEIAASEADVKAEETLVASRRRDLAALVDPHNGRKIDLSERQRTTAVAVSSLVDSIDATPRRIAVDVVAPTMGAHARAPSPVRAAAAASTGSITDGMYIYMSPRAKQELARGGGRGTRPHSPSSRTRPAASQPLPSAAAGAGADAAGDFDEDLRTAAASLSHAELVLARRTDALARDRRLLAVTRNMASLLATRAAGVPAASPSRAHTSGDALVAGAASSVNALVDSALAAGARDRAAQAVRRALNEFQRTAAVLTDAEGATVQGLLEEYETARARNSELHLRLQTRAADRERELEALRQQLADLQNGIVRHKARKLLGIAPGSTRGRSGGDEDEYADDFNIRMYGGRDADDGRGLRPEQLRGALTDRRAGTAAPAGLPPTTPPAPRDGGGLKTPRQRTPLHAVSFSSPWEDRRNAKPSATVTVGVPQGRAFAEPVEYFEEGPSRPGRRPTPSASSAMSPPPPSLAATRRPTAPRRFTEPRP